MIDYDNIIELFKNFDSHTDNYMGAMFINIFHDCSYPYRVYFNTEGIPAYNLPTKAFDFHKDVKYKIDTRKLLDYLMERSDINSFYNTDDCPLYVFCYSNYEYLVVFNDGFTKALINLTLTDEQIAADYYITIYTNNIDTIFEYIKNGFVKIETKSNVEFGIAAVDVSNSLYTSWYDYSSYDIDIKKNYNDDIPYDKMCELIEAENHPELLLFYGDPGTGKTSLIKHFISKYHNKSFVFIDGTLLAHVPQQKLMSYFLENQDTIFVLEDCEKILMNREHYANPVMPVLLNLTDGIIGDVLGIKFICTFNTSLSNIDKALIRKGRLSLKYEFKKLSKEKATAILGKNVTTEMNLADIYYENEENDFSKKQQNKIGF